MNIFTALHVFFYRTSSGRIGGRFRGAPVLLLTTTGRKSSKPRTTPLLYISDGDDFVIVASNGGRDRDPSWWTNLRRNPESEIQIKGEKRKVSAEKASDEQKKDLWPLVTKMYPTYDDYQNRTKREIPVVILKPRRS